MAKEKEESKEAKPGVVTKAWKVTIPNSTHTGKLKYVSFSQGVGCLCGYGMAAECPENFVCEAPNFRQVKGVPIEEYARYFSTRGFKVEELSVEEGLKLYQTIDREARDFKPSVLGAKPEPVESKPEKKTESGREVLPHEELARSDESAPIQRHAKRK